MRHLLLAGALVLVLGGCAGLAAAPDRIADRVLGAADTPIARALRFDAIGLVVCEIAVDRAVADVARAPAALSACTRLGAAMGAVDRAAEGPWFEAEMHAARRVLYQVLRDGLDLPAPPGGLAGLDVPGLDLAGLAARVAGRALAVTKIAALRADLRRLLAPGELVGDPPTSEDAEAVRRIIAARFNANVARVRLAGAVR